MGAFVQALRALLEALLGSLAPSPKKTVEAAPERPPVRPADVSSVSEAPKSVHDVSLIKRFEGCELEAYKDPVGIVTIGYGHTATAKMGMKITQRGAEELLRHDLEWVEKAINQYVLAPINQNQYDALASFVYNVGAGAFKKSTLLKKLNKKDYEGAANEFQRWNKAGGKVLRGLTLRRKAEAEKFRNERH